MPRTVILFVSIILFIFIVNAHNAQASVLTYVDEIQREQDQEFILVDENITWQILAGSLSTATRVSFWSESISDIVGRQYRWQILDAEVNKIMKLKIPRPRNEQISVVPQISANGIDWQVAEYTNVGEYVELYITEKNGYAKVAELPLVAVDINLDAPTVQKGYPVATSDTYFNFYILPHAFTQSARIQIKPLSATQFTFPADKKLISPIYYFYIDAATNEFPKLDLPIDIKYFTDAHNTKDIYYWDNVAKIWYPSPSLTRVNEGVVRTQTHQREMILAVFESDIMEQGSASWYRYKNGDFAASPDYEKGTKLKVTNIVNGKSVIVTVNDYGPDRSIHPERVIDLDRVAFQKIASPSLGVVDVIVEENYY